MNVDVLFGLCGSGNIGDESTLKGLARLVSRHNNGMHASVASRNPSESLALDVMQQTLAA